MQRTTARRPPKTAVAVVALVGVAGAFGAAGYFGYARHTQQLHAATSRIEAANLDLQDELAKLRDQMAASRRELSNAQSRVASLGEELHNQPKAQAQPQPAEEAAAKSEKVAQLSKSLHVAEAQRATMAARLSKAEADLAEEQTRQSQIQATLEQLQKQLQLLSAERDKTIGERDRLRAKVGELEQKLSMAQAPRPLASAAPPAQAHASAQPPARMPVAAAVETPTGAPQRMAMVVVPRVGPTTAVATPAAPVVAAPAAVAPAVAAPVAAAPAVRTVPRGAGAAVGQFERVLASAGVDVRHLFVQFGVNRGEGGPFIPAPRGAQVPTLSPEKLVALRSMLKVLPVSAPLDGYKVSSPFGVRGDPENDRAGFHTGLDMTAPYMSPVYATAPGVVTYAGYRNDYGKIVEIDHGNGIATRYAHLHAFTVSVGQRVGAHSQIGYLGSTGRATGPHVHYEVLVNGEPQDPEKFLGLAQYVPAIVPAAARN